MKKFFIKTFGCQMNIYDSINISNILKKKNKFIKTNNINKANLIILNTCSIREKTQNKIFSYLGKISKIKKNKIICLCGCLIIQENINILKKINFINIILNSKFLYKLPNLIKQYIKNKYIYIYIYI